MKKSTITEFLDVLTSDVAYCLFSKRTVSKLNFLRFNVRTILPFVFMALMFEFNTANAQLQGLAPVQTPTGGFAVDGDAFANTPAPFMTYGNNTGDWFRDIINYPGTGGGLFNPDGTVIDSTRTFFLQDVWSADDPTIFTSSNKINDDPNTYTWGMGTSPNKNEIQNVGVHFTHGSAALGGNPSDLWCLFAGDRQVTNGSSYIDFEFLQKTLTMTGTTSGGFSSLGTQGGRTVGDLLVTIEFVNGGGAAVVEIQKWEAVGAGFQYVPHNNSEFVGSIFITENTSVTSVPFDVYGSGIPGTYDVNQWAEGAINLTQVLNIAQNPCYVLSTVFVRTRSSGSSHTSELKDFPGPPIQLDLDMTPTASAVASPALCNGGSTGSATITFSGGTPPYQVSFNGGAFETQTSPKTYSGLAAGTYNWAVKDSNDCDPSGSVTVTQPTAVVASDAHTNALCNGSSDGTVTVTFSGGTSPYMVNFNGGGFATQTSPKEYSGLAAGTYTWVVKDANNCEQSGSEDVGQPTAVVASDAHTNALCNGSSDGTVTVTFSGGTSPYMVNFNGGGFVAQTSPKEYSGLLAGTYTWVVKDANNCEQSGSEDVGQPTAVVASDAHTNALCNGSSDGTVTVTFSGGTSPYMVNFNGAGFVTQTSPKEYSGLAAGTYTWVVKDANNCEQSGSEDVGEPTEVVASDAHTNALCNGSSDGTVTVTFSGGTSPYMVNFNGGGFATQTSPKEYSGLLAGTYTWVVKDANNCEQSGSVTVTQPTAVVASDAHTNALCNGSSDGTVTVTFSGGTSPYMVNFNGGGFATQTSPKEYSGLAAGTYTWVVKDANNCEQSGSEVVGEPTAVVASDAHTDVSCNGGADGTITLTFSDGTIPHTVSFNGGEFIEESSPKTYSGLAAGTYTWVVKDANNCDPSGSETVGQPTAVVASDAHTNALCNGSSDGTVTVTFSGGTSPYMVNFNGGGFATQTSPKEYSGLLEGNYTWVVKDANNCEQSGSEDVGQPTAVVASDAHTDALCNGSSDGTVTVTFSGGTSPYMVNFNGGGFVAQTSPKEYSGLAAGTYTWVVKDANNCEQSGSEDVGEPTEVVATDASTEATCEDGTDGTVTLTFSGGTPPYYVNFNSGGFVEQTSPKTYSGLAVGTYDWAVKDANDCSISGSEDVGFVPCVKALCTYTQGYYGNLGGMSCAGEGDTKSYTTTELIAKSLASYGGTMTIGLVGHSVLISNNETDINAIIARLPGGGGSYVLPSGNIQISALTDSYLRKGRINNTLLAQTITLGLNLGIDGTLGGFELKPKFYTAEPENGCGSDIPKVRECVYNDQTGYFEVINEYKDWSINPKVVTALGSNATVQGLFEMANTALGDGGTPVGVTLSDIAGAVDLINNAFDGCKIFMGYNVEPLVCASAESSFTSKTTSETGFEFYPVPFKDQLTIRYKFDYISDVKIEIFNSNGILVLSKTDANGYLNKEITLNLNLYTGQEQVYVVKVTTNRESITKKIMSSK